MEFKLSNFDAILNDIPLCIIMMKKSYDSPWNDNVHNSFYEFIYLVEEKTKDVIVLIAKLKNTLESLKDVDSKILNDRCEEIFSRLESEL